MTDPRDDRFGATEAPGTDNTDARTAHFAATDPNPSSNPRVDLSTPGDPKDHHAIGYTTDPAVDWVGSQDRSSGAQAPSAESGEGAQTFKGVNALVTRDPEQMEHTAQAAAYAGAEPTLDALGTFHQAAIAGSVSPAGGMGAGIVAGSPARERSIDPNPGYTSPSEQSAPHPNEGSAGLPAGAPGEQYLEENLNDTVTPRKERG